MKTIRISSIFAFAALIGGATTGTVMLTSYCLGLSFSGAAGTGIYMGLAMGAAAGVSGYMHRKIGTRLAN